jgi:hypothetical protein
MDARRAKQQGETDLSFGSNRTIGWFGRGESSDWEDGQNGGLSLSFLTSSRRPDRGILSKNNNR